MKITNPFSSLSKGELMLWLGSMLTVTVSFLFSDGGILTLTASLIGVTSLIFIARGLVIGQVLMVLFSLLYGIISFFAQYYGEVVTYVFMTAPMAIATAIVWIKHPFKDSKEVEITHLTPLKLIIASVLSIIVTALFYFILSALGTASIVFSTLSVTTSFIACALTFLRSPYYAIGYAANDLVLIILWIMAAAENSSNLPMIFCFAVFFVNDLYGFISWRKIRSRQENKS